MWINLTKDEIGTISAALSECKSLGLSGCSELITKIQTYQTAGPYDALYRGAVKTSDELEVEEDAIVSPGDDPGAWVHAWVWVSDDDAGLQTEDDENTCRTCGEEYADGGDGYDGECPSCADKTDQKLHPENYE